MTRLIILDRDGVINRDSDKYIKSPDEWEPIPGSMEAIAQLNQLEYQVVVATNQSGIGQGLLTMDTLNAIHQKMIRALTQVGGRLEAIFFCPHKADAHCQCRKPGIGMLEEIHRRFNAPLQGSPMVGDGLRDMQAAVAVGARPFLVFTGKGLSTSKDPLLPKQTMILPNLAAVVEHLSAHEG